MISVSLKKKLRSEFSWGASTNHEKMSSVASLMRRASNWSINSHETNLIVHPLVKYDPCALDYIKVLKAAYFESPAHGTREYEFESNDNQHASCLVFRAHVPEHINGC